MIQHLILEGHTTDAIEKTKELFPTLLNNKNLLFTLKVRQFIEMINGTESEISSSSVVSSHTTNNCLVLKTRKSTSRSSSPITKPQTSSHSRSNSPYTQANSRNMHSSSRRSSTNNPELSQGTSLEFVPRSSTLFLEPNTTVNSNNTVPNLMDIDDDLYGPSTSNGFANHGTVVHSSTNPISNGHTLIDDETNLNSNGCANEKLDSMDHDGNTQSNSIDDQLLVRILQFGKELHALKQQLHNEYGENTQNEKMLQVELQKIIERRIHSSCHGLCLGCFQSISLSRSKIIATCSPIGTISA